MAAKAKAADPVAEPDTNPDTDQAQDDTPRQDSFRGKAQDVDPPAAGKKGAAQQAAADEGDDEGTIDDEDGDVEYIDEIDADEFDRLKADAQRAKDLEAQLAQLNSQLKEVSSKVKGYEREKMTAEEKREAELREATETAATLRQQLRTQAAELAITRHASTFNVNPELAQELLAGKLEFDDEGKPKNVEQVMRALIQKFPNLVERAAPPSRGNGDKPNGRNGQTPLTLQEISTWTPEMVNARWPEVEAVMTASRN